MGEVTVTGWAQTLKVVLVEDSTDDARLIRQMLEEVEDFAVDLVHVDTLHAGLDRLLKEGFDVLLLDLDLPDSSGLATFLRARAAAPWSAIVVLSGDADKDTAFRAVREGAHDYWLKAHTDRHGLARTVRYAARHKRIAEDQHFLSAAGDVLSSTLEYEETVGHVVRLAVPLLGSAAVLELEPDAGSRSRVLVHDFDGRRHNELRHAARAGAVVGLNGAAVLADAIQELGFSAHLSTELMASGRVLGRLTVLRTWSAPAFEPRDAMLLAELAQRCSVGIDKARLYRELEVAARMTEEVLATTSHDLRSPLSGIGMQLNAIRRLLATTEDCPRDQIAAGLDHMDAAIERSLDLLQELQDATALHAGHQLQLRKRPTDLRAVVEHVLVEYRLRTDYHRLVLDAPAEPLMGTWDEDRIARVVDNLLSNATKYSLEPDVITVELRVVTELDAEWAVLRVIDHGLGIPDAEVHHVFDRFYRGSNVPPDIRGSGIGLWGVRQIVDQHGGFITVQTRERQGSTFSVRLPR